MKRFLALIIATVILVGATGGTQVCSDYLFAGRPAPDISTGFYVERIVCLTPSGRLEPVDHPDNLPGLEAVNEALLMELLATQRLAEFRLIELNYLVATGNLRPTFRPVVYMTEEHQ